VNLISLEACQSALAGMVDELLAEIATKAADRRIHKAFVKVKFADFTRTTKECVCETPDLDTYLSLLEVAYARRQQSVRLLGAGVRFVDIDSAPSVVQGSLGI
jgi:DNA polymerase-4